MILGSHLRLLLKLRDCYQFGANGGSALSLGVQDIQMTHDGIKTIFADAGVPCKDVKNPTFTDTRTTPRERNYAHVSNLFEMLGYADFKSMDYSDAERPDIIHDLNTPIPEALHESCDLIYDGGTVEHVVDIFQALSNCAKLLKVGGTMIHAVPLSGWHNQCFYNIQPPLFCEFYTANGFENDRTFLNYYSTYKQHLDRPHEYREYKYGDELNFIKPGFNTILFFFATKTRPCTDIVKPIQGFYQRHNDMDVDSGAQNTEDGRSMARIKNSLPGGLRTPLVAIKNTVTKVALPLIPMSLQERMWSRHLKSYLTALDRNRETNIFRL